MKNEAIKFLELKDANELINLYSLVDRNKLLKTLEKNMVKYINDYFKSFVKSFNEVLEYIPEKDYIFYLKDEDEKDFVKYLESYLTTFNYWREKVIIDKNEKLFIIDVFNHKIYQVYDRFKYGFGIEDYYFTKNKHLKLHHIYERHSTTSRPHNPCILERKMYCYIFDLSNNTFVQGMELYKHDRFYGDNSWNRILDFVKGDSKRWKDEN